MRTFTNGTDTVECFDAQVWQQERNLIYFHHNPAEGDATTVKLYTNIQGSSAYPIARYALDSAKRAIIDVSDYIRANPGVTSIIIECQQDEPISIPMQVVGFINPDNLLIPAVPYDLQEIHEVELQIAPPKVIYQSPLDMMIEFRGKNLYGDQNNAITHRPNIPEQLINAGTNMLPASWPELIVMIEQETVARIPIREVPCGVVPAFVQWMGVTGALKSAIWLVSKHTIEADGAMQLMPIESDYRTMKGRKEGLSIYLDGMTDYDLWYYSDILTSSYVFVLVGDEIKEENLESGIIKERFIVDVVNNSVTLPDGNAGELSKLEVELNWRKYNAAYM